MENQSKIIVMLLIVIVIFSIILGLKITGIIKPVEKETKKTEEYTNVKVEKTINDESNSQINELLQYKKYGKNENTTNTIFYLIIYIFIFILLFTLAIGRFIMYRRLGVSTILNIFYMLLTTGILLKILNAFALIIPRAILIFIALISVILIVCAKVSYYNKLNIKGILITIPWIIGIVLDKLFNIGDIIIVIDLIILYIFEIIAAIRLTNMLNKNIVYRLFAIVLPWIIVPILGFQKEEI